MSESVQAIPPFVDSPAPYGQQQQGRRRAPTARPTAREWRKHGLLFLLTALTTTFAGVMLVSNIAEPELASPQSFLDYLFYVPELYLKVTAAYLQHAFLHPSIIAQGLAFAGALLAILTAHEAGHYIACRRYNVAATLPFFIPAPPLFLAGTFGAFIKIRSPIPSRRALFDIGVAGPLAGFVVALPIAALGIWTAPPATPIVAEASQQVIVFNDPLLMQLLAGSIGRNLDININPLYFASWIGLLVTSLNLMPVGQLDGGHATYALFGARLHKWIGRVAFVLMSSLAILGWVWHSSPSGFLYALLLGVLLRIRHPQVEDDGELLDRPRVIVAIFTLMVFALSFLPFPIKIV